jgi:tetratricopeptide (TPR) repeat protein
MRHAGRVAAAAIAAFILLAGAVELQAVRERLYPPSPADEATLYLRSGPALRRLTIAYNALAADVYWIRAIQFYGGAKRRLEANLLAAPPPPPMLAAPPDDYDLLYPLLDITTTLDPRFNIAYRFGAVFLAEPFPGGAGRPDLAVALLQKGLRERPDKWEYMEDIGFVHYWYVRDYHAAAAWFQKASEAPRAPWWLKSLAATTLAQGGDRQSSRTMWRAILQSAEIDWLRNDARRRLTQLDVLDMIDELQRRVDAYARSHGERPDDWSLLFRGVPADPTGTPFELVDGQVRLAQRSPLWPLPDEPGRADQRTTRPPA